MISLNQLHLFVKFFLVLLFELRNDVILVIVVVVALVKRHFRFFFLFWRCLGLLKVIPIQDSFYHRRHRFCVVLVHLLVNRCSNIFFESSCFQVDKLILTLKQRNNISLKKCVIYLLGRSHQKIRKISRFLVA